MQNSFTKLASIWFGENERTKAATVMILADAVGCILGYLLGPSFVLDSDRIEGNWDRGRLHFRDLVFTTAILSTIMCLPTLLLYKANP